MRKDTFLRYCNYNNQDRVHRGLPASETSNGSHSHALSAVRGTDFVEAVADLTRFPNSNSIFVLEMPHLDFSGVGSWARSLDLNPGSLLSQSILSHFSVLLANRH